jgi:transcriptional regulator GlxA family with amidase domain
MPRLNQQPTAVEHAGMLLRSKLHDAVYRMEARGYKDPLSELATVAGISRATVLRRFREPEKCTLREIALYARFIGITVGEMLSPIGNPQ